MEHLKEHLRWYFLIGLMLVVGVIWYAIFSESRRDVLTVSFLDVGQGDAILTLVTQYAQ
jgi:beta-lactamase superfamily II metal-dependent hydrolase|tara:strand:+ start:15276 stop:15452 length:177 start_codon:yes stop_codon:yes gene_type:complete